MRRDIAKGGQYDLLWIGAQQLGAMTVCVRRDLDAPLSKDAIQEPVQWRRMQDSLEVFVCVFWGHIRQAIMGEKIKQTAAVPVSTARANLARGLPQVRWSH
jgi:hypothetical protein